MLYKSNNLLIFYFYFMAHKVLQWNCCITGLIFYTFQSLFLFYVALQCFLAGWLVFFAHECVTNIFCIYTHCCCYYFFIHILSIYNDVLFTINGKFFRYFLGQIYTQTYKIYKISYMLWNVKKLSLFFVAITKHTQFFNKNIFIL